MPTLGLTTLTLTLGLTLTHPEPEPDPEAKAEAEANPRLTLILPGPAVGLQGSVSVAWRYLALPAAARAAARPALPQQDTARGRGAHAGLLTRVAR